MTLFVNEMYFPNDMEIDGVYGEEMIDSPGGFKIWWAIVPGILIVIGIIVFVVIRRKKKKAQELLELEEDLDDAGEEDLSDDDETETEKLSPWKKWKKRRAEKRNGL